MNRTNYALVALTISALLFGQSVMGNKLELIGEYIVPNDMAIDGMVFGGISGLTYDADSKQYYALSDARNNTKDGAARFYTLTIDADKTRLQHVTLLKMHKLLNDKEESWAEGQVDPEGITLSPDGKGIMWTSELGSAIRISDFDGKFIADLNAIIPPYFNTAGVSDKNSMEGVRSNNSFEGLSITPDKKTVFIGVESALRQDGDVSTTINGSPTRLLKFTVNPDNYQLDLSAEYIYLLDPIPLASTFGSNDNGLSEVLGVDEHQLLVVERSGRQVTEDNKWGFNIRVYLVDISNATDIKGVESLRAVQEKAKLQPVSKKLLLNFSDYTEDADNVEGLTFGPVIDGHKTLVFVTDNNFKSTQKNKFYLFIDRADLLK